MKNDSKLESFKNIVSSAVIQKHSHFKIHCFIANSKNGSIHSLLQKEVKQKDMRMVKNGAKETPLFLF